MREEKNGYVETLSDWDLVMTMPDIGKYIGKWVSVVEGEIVAVGDSLKEVYLKALEKRKDCNSIPFIVKIPEGGHMIFAAM